MSRMSTTTTAESTVEEKVYLRMGRTTVVTLERSALSSTALDLESFSRLVYSVDEI